MDKEEKVNYNFVVVAASVSTSFVAKAAIEVLVINVNDNKPWIYAASYVNNNSKDNNNNQNKNKTIINNGKDLVYQFTFNLSERALLGSFIGQVHATDIDQSENSMLTYFVDDPFSYFDVDEQNGKIFLIRLSRVMLICFLPFFSFDFFLLKSFITPL